MFSKEKIGVSGRMDDSNSVHTKMKRFILQYGYDKDTILAATKLYLVSQRNSPMYISRAGYFIFKQEGAKSEERSLLAAYCDEVKRSGGVKEEKSFWRE